MTEVTLPDRVVSIRENAFGNCKELTNVMIPESVETIDFFAF